MDPPTEPPAKKVKKYRKEKPWDTAEVEHWKLEEWKDEYSPGSLLEESACGAEIHVVVLALDRSRKISSLQTHQPTREDTIEQMNRARWKIISETLARVSEGAAHDFPAKTARVGSL